MNNRFLIPLLVVALCGCTNSKTFSYYAPTGGGRVVKDAFNVPRSMEYQFGTGSIFRVSTERTAANTTITFWTLLTEPASFTTPAEGISLSCGTNETVSLPPAAWREWRIKDGIGYSVDHGWRDSLPGRDPRALKRQLAAGDFSSGEHWASMTFSGCNGIPFSFDLPIANGADTVYRFGRISLTPEAKRFRWLVPIQ